MSKRFISIFILSSGTSKARQIDLPIERYKLIRNSLIVLAVIITYICADYARIRFAHIEFSELKRKNVAQKIELNEFARKINEVEGRLARLKDFDKKLRIIANIETPKIQGDEAMGMGGASLESVDFPTVKDKRGELVEKMHAELTQIDASVNVQEKSFIELQSYLSEQSSMLASTPSVWPSRGWVSSGFGKRASPFTGLSERHTGIDIANRMGTAVLASADGLVVYSAGNGSLGKTVRLKHGYGLKTSYGHMSKILVKKGERVKRGQKLGEMGNTGRSTGPHLHYDVTLNGVHVNPFNYILN